VQKARNAQEVAVDALRGDGHLDQVDRRAPRVPHRRGGISAEVLVEVGEELIRDHRQMRRGVTGVDGRTQAAFDERDAKSGQLQQIGRGDPGDATTDDGHVDRDVAIERRE
jgi:hypothetical protein